VPYTTTRGVVLRCTDFSETSQVVALIAPDLGQVHALANGSLRPQKGARTPLDRVTERSYGPSKKPALEPKSAKGSADTAFHARNFLDCIKSRKKCNCDILIGHLSTSATIIGHIALRTKSYLEWDARAERFTNSAAANKFLSYQYRAPYKLG
jgi:hypothetical protein